MKKSLMRVMKFRIIEEFIFISIITTFLIFMILKSWDNTLLLLTEVFLLLCSLYILVKILKRYVTSNNLGYFFKLANSENGELNDMNKIRYIELDKIMEHFVSFKLDKISSDEKLKDKSRELRQIIDLVPHKIFSKNIEGKYLFVNKATADGFGLTPQELEGKTDFELNLNKERYPEDEIRKFLKDDLEVILSNRTKFIPDESNHNLDGSVSIMKTTKIPFSPSFSGQRAILGIAIDITKEKKITNQLIEHQLELEQNYELLKQHNEQIDTLNVELEEFQKEIVHIMIKMLEIHDKYTKGHSENVAELSKLIAEELKLSPKAIKQAYWAGLLHDIGKTVVPTDILNKDSNLDIGEYTVIKNHPLWGHSVLKNSKQLSEIGNFILYHHEKWDATGYPVGLEKEEIPLISQILAVADCWDAMTSKRSYRDPMDRDSAIKEILNNSGKQFSPNIVKVFMDLIDRGEIQVIPS